MQVMKDDRTPEQRLAALVNAVEICKQANWKWVGPNWIFKSPSGTLHDLSAADLTKLSSIERNNHFAVD
jgi:hypothetical protein